MTEERKFYVDTNVVVARYKPRDELYDAAKRLFEGRTFNFYVSSLSMVELYSVLSRVKVRVDVPSLAAEALNTLVAFIVRDCRLKVIGVGSPIERKLGGELLRTSSEYYLSMKSAEKLRLRTLDLIHLAYASLARTKLGVSAFITGDEEILHESEPIHRVLKFRAVHPAQVP